MPVLLLESVRQRVLSDKPPGSRQEQHLYLSNGSGVHWKQEVWALCWWPILIRHGHISSAQKEVHLRVDLREPRSIHGLEKSHRQDAWNEATGPQLHHHEQLWWPQGQWLLLVPRATGRQDNKWNLSERPLLNHRGCWSMGQVQQGLHRFYYQLHLEGRQRQERDILRRRVLPTRADATERP